MKSKLKFLTITVLVLVAVFAIYHSYIGNGGKDGKNIESLDANSGSAEFAGGDVSGVEETLALLNKTRSVVLDVSFFQGAAFRNLMDFSVEIAPEPVGRDNPFMPLSKK